MTTTKPLPSGETAAGPLLPEAKDNHHFCPQDSASDRQANHMVLKSPALWARRGQNHSPYPSRHSDGHISEPGEFVQVSLGVQYSHSTPCCLIRTAAFPDRGQRGHKGRQLSLVSLSSSHSPGLATPP